MLGRMIGLLRERARSVRAIGADRIVPQRLDRVIRGANEYRIALMCAEKEPLDCHRTLLVARALAELGVTVQHILADGRLESHDATMERLLDVVGLPGQDLFRSRDELIAEALGRQEERVAYVDEKLAADAGKESP